MSTNWDLNKNFEGKKNEWTNNIINQTQNKRRKGLHVGEREAR